MKSEQEIKQMLEDYEQCYNDKSEKYRKYSQSLTYQGIDVLKWVLGYSYKGCPKCGWGPEETIEKYRKVIRAKRCLKYNHNGCQQTLEQNN